jgi:hypothetical protein
MVNGDRRSAFGGHLISRAQRILQSPFTINRSPFTKPPGFLEL